MTYLLIQTCFLYIANDKTCADNNFLQIWKIETYSQATFGVKIELTRHNVDIELTRHNVDVELTRHDVAIELTRHNVAIVMTFL